MRTRSNYDDALKEVLAIRRQRQKIYGDNWKGDADWELLALIKQKTGRLEDFVINKKDSKTYENEKDTLIDIINYALFLLQNKIDREKIREVGKSRK